MGGKSSWRILDFYRKIPQDLTETTRSGQCLSVCTVIFILLLFGAELSAFLNRSAETSLVLDPNEDLKLRINFNITLLELPCEYAAVDIYDVLGTNKLNYSKNVLKWNVGEDGQRNQFHGREEQKPRKLEHDDHQHDHSALIIHGQHAEEVNAARLKEILAQYDYVMVAFVVPWCIWCQRLTSTWEAFAQTDQEREQRVPVIQVDCMIERDLCSVEFRVHAFPTIRLFKKGESFLDYNLDRTVDALSRFLKENAKPLGVVIPEVRITPGGLVKPNEHIGCQMSGFLLVNRVPGNFHVEPRSHVHSFNAPMTNLSHIVHNLHFGHRSFPRRDLPVVGGELLNGLQAVTDKAFITTKAHQSPHHYIDVVSTFYEKTFFGSSRDYNQYQIIMQDQLVQYDEDETPEAMFKYDLSAVAVFVKAPKRRFYQFLTSLCAILGGTFTFVGIVNMILLKILKPKKS